MSSLYESLKRHVQGDLMFDASSRFMYSMDASIYRVQPLGVVVPKNHQDLIATVQVAAEHGVPLVPRGAATGTTGGCLGEALILDTSRYLQGIIQVDYEAGYAEVEPGVVQDHLNAVLAKRGFRLGPDTSTGNRATLGGMLANNAAGAHSLKYGSMVDHIEQVRLVLSDGATLCLESLDASSWKQRMQMAGREGEIYRGLDDLRRLDWEHLRHSFPESSRRVSGYLLDHLARPFPVNPARLIAGSEGTLGVITSMRVRIVRAPRARGLLVLGFDRFDEALDAVYSLTLKKPLALELIDRPILQAGRRSPMMRGRLDWLEGEPVMLLVLEIEGESSAQVSAELKKWAQDLERSRTGNSIRIFEDPVRMREVWDLRKAGLGLLQSGRTREKAIAFLEDVAVPPRHLAEFLKRFQALIEGKGKTSSFYGHAGDGCVHVRPMMDLGLAADRETMIELMETVTPLLKEYRGALSGEHGDGLVRSWLNPALFGSEVTAAFHQLKTIFDPKGLMNPGKIVRGADPLAHLRQDTLNPAPETFLDFGKEGGLPFAVSQCNGNGECRKRSRAVMCPSYQGTLDERHSTRARAQGLLWLIEQEWNSEALRDPALAESLDLCLQCKACKTECPSQVDMAKMKSEYLYHKQKKEGVPLRSRIIGHLDRVNRLGSLAPGLTNRFMRSAAGRLLWSALGFAPGRTFPALAAKRFSRLHPCGTFADSTVEPDVIFFNDTFNEFHEPHIGEALFRLLKRQELKVVTAPYVCCGRPLLSKGMLEPARGYAARVVGILHPWVQKGIPVIGLEPSCLLTIRDDYPALLPGKACQEVAAACRLAEEWLEGERRLGHLRAPKVAAPAPSVHLHGHCYQKALSELEGTLNLLRFFGAAEAEGIDAGCCGMAGSFGYEKEHEDLSHTIALQRLFPAIEKLDAGAWIAGSGFSCRTQIANGLGRECRHPVEILDRLQGGVSGHHV